MASPTAPYSRLTLWFHDPALERAFRAEYSEAARRPTRATFLIIVAIYAAYAFLDYALYRDAFWRLAGIRAAVIAVLLVAFLLTWTRVYERARIAIVLSATAATAGGLFAMGLIVLERGDAPFHTGLALVILGTATLFRLPFPAVVAVAFVIPLTYVVTAVAGGRAVEGTIGGLFLLISSSVIGIAAAYTLERYARRSFLHERAIDAERARSDALLLNILPAPIVQRLKVKPGPIADRFPAATILFADLVEFAPLSADLPPEELVAFLNRTFTGLDRIATAHGLEKIKTIGDAYMAVAGVPVPRPDHLEAVADAALAMREFAARQETARDGPALAMRIGIASGPVVAGVIGETKFIYDLWGEAVTTASRMETHGVRGAIQVTDDVRRRLDGHYRFEPRGEIEVKGRGTMRTWLLVGKLVASS